MTEDLNNSNVSSGSSDFSNVEEGETDFKIPFEKDFYGCYCLKFRVKHGTSVTEQHILEQFGAYGQVMKVWGAGVDEETRFPNPEQEDPIVTKAPRLDSVVCVWFKRRLEAESALEGLREVYHELTPAISDVLLPDNFGLFTISFTNKVCLSTKQIHKEFSDFGPIKKLTGKLEMRDGRVFVSYQDKESATQAFIHKTERWYPFMRFEFPKCERDYMGCYCLKFYNSRGTENFATEDQVMREFSKFGVVADIRGPGLFDVQGNDVYVRYREKASAQVALSSLVGYYDNLCITPASDIVQDKFGLYTLTFVNNNNLTDLEVRNAFQKFGQLAQVSGTWGSTTGRVFVAYHEKEGATSALSAMVSSKDFRLQIARGKKSCQYWSAGPPNKRKMKMDQELPSKRLRGGVLSSINRGEEVWREKGVGRDQFRGGHENRDPDNHHDEGRRGDIERRKEDFREGGRRVLLPTPADEFDDMRGEPSKRMNYYVEDQDQRRLNYEEVGESRYTYRERHYRSDFGEY